MCIKDNSAFLGVYYKVDKSNDHLFFDDIRTDRLIGSIIYTVPIGRDVAKSISPLVDASSVYELVRLWVADGYGRNIESYVLGKSFDWLKIHRPHIKALISYADPEAGHDGIVYRATNWLYQSAKDICPYENIQVSLSGPPEKYEWLHSRTITDKFGPNNIENLKKTIGKTFWIKKKLKKHRYVYVLGSKKERKDIIRTLKHPVSHYPKAVGKIVSEVTRVDI